MPAEPNSQFAFHLWHDARERPAERRPLKRNATRRPRSAFEYTSMCYLQRQYRIYGQMEKRSRSEEDAICSPMYYLFLSVFYFSAFRLNVFYSFHIARVSDKWSNASFKYTRQAKNNIPPTIRLKFVFIEVTILKDLYRVLYTYTYIYVY